MRFGILGTTFPLNHISAPVSTDSPTFSCPANCVVFAMFPSLPPHSGVFGCSDCLTHRNLRAQRRWNHLKCFANVT